MGVASFIDLSGKIFLIKYHGDDLSRAGRVFYSSVIANMVLEGGWKKQWIELSLLSSLLSCRLSDIIFN